jgi:predicted NBD/HSP70 family sugar kinase
MPDGTDSLTVARPRLMREMNTRAVLDLLRKSGPLSRADLGRLTGLSKPTVQLALSNAESAGLIEQSGHRQGLPGPAAMLYKISSQAGHVLALDIGERYLRGAVSDLAGEVLARRTVRTRATDALGRVGELIQFSRALREDATLPDGGLLQTVLGSPGIYDPAKESLWLAGSLSGWGSPEVITELRREFGVGLLIENDVDMAAVAERATGHARDIDTFAFVSIGTGVGVGLVIGGQLHRGKHGAAGEVAYLPFPAEGDHDTRESSRVGLLEAAASASGIVKRAKRAGLSGHHTAEAIFTSAHEGDPAAARVVAEEADLVARVLTTLIVVVDPELIVLGGGIGQAPGFVAAVKDRVRAMAPVLPEITVSALGEDSVVNGALAQGVDEAWRRVTTPEADEQF